MKRVCTICVRAGSKGVKNKNIRPLLGKPLLAYSLEQALSTDLFDTVAVSSDSDQILEIAKANGAQVLIKRPDEMATDTAAKVPAIRHCLAAVEENLGLTFDTVVDLDATSPLRLSVDIANCVKLLEGDRRVTNVITGAPSRRSPYFNMVECDPDGRVRLSKTLQSEVVRRQDGPKCYDLNASIYVWRRDALMVEGPLITEGTRLQVMPDERSWDIDSEMDFNIVELMMKHANEEGC